MNKAKTIITAGLIASSAVFSAATPLSATSVAPSSTENASATDFYKPESDDPTVQFPLVVVDTHDAFVTWCAISDASDEHFAVVAPRPDLSTTDFINYLTEMTGNFEVDQDRVYLVVSDDNAPLAQDPAAAELFAALITVDYTSHISPEIVADLLSRIRQ